MTAHVLAAAMHFFGMSCITDKPGRNALADTADTTPNNQWCSLQQKVEVLVDRYIMVGGMADIQPKQTEVQVQDSNPHALRIEAEHNYASIPPSDSQRQRILPQWLLSSRDEPSTVQNIQKRVPDGVLNYASAVLNDGLLLFELRDAIHEGDGPRLLRCWKLMMLYWRHAGHTKYALEAVHLLGAVNATATPRIAHELTWCRFVNNCGGAGNNLPVDLYMEHLNRTLKDYLSNTGANISESSIIRAGKSLHGLFQITTQFDRTSGVNPELLHHTKREYGKDLELILHELVSTSHVFDYVPGRCHSTFKNIKPHITSNLDTDKLMQWLRLQVKNISRTVQLRNIYHPS